MCESPVLLIFFNRPDFLKKTFEQVRKARPKKLYLAQDGPRDNNDMKKILECREVVNNIDWECKVFKKFSEKNLGCGEGPHSAINWVFEKEERAIILEDDCVASESFFPFCDELLERYKDDERIFLITGCNFRLEEEKKESSYFFGFSGTNWGWATWKRNWKEMDYSCSWISDEHESILVKNFLYNSCPIKANKEIKLFNDTFKRVKHNERLSYWDVQWQSIKYLSNQLCIIPCVNLITNIGIGEESTHAKTTIIPQKLHSRKGKFNFTYNKKYELIFPLRHPKHIVRKVEYDEKVDKKLYPSLLIKLLKKLRIFR